MEGGECLQLHQLEICSAVGCYQGFLVYVHLNCSLQISKTHGENVIAVTEESFRK